MSTNEKSSRKQFAVDDATTWSREDRIAIAVMGFDFDGFLHDIWAGKYTRDTLLEVREILRLPSKSSEFRTTEQAEALDSAGITAIDRWLAAHDGIHALDRWLAHERGW